jgi:hypothetical protein
MIRTQIQLTEEQARRLRELAAAQGVSLAAIIREAVDRYARDGSELESRWARALGVRGYRDRSRATDVAADHDRYVSEAFAG